MASFCIDWIVYGAFEICETAEVGTVECCEPDQRPFRIPDESGLWPKRRHLISTTPDVAMIETAVFKRPWLGRQGIFGHSTKDLSEEIGEAASAWLAAFAEEQLKNPGAPLPVREIAAALERDAAAMRVTGLLSSSTLAALTAAFTLAEAVPFSSAYRHTESGLEKRTIWERTWDLQRAEDRGEKIDTIPVPPRYDQKDYRDPTYWRLRGKLDVPKERFISYPGCESDQDGEPVYGWAGWNHLQQAQALAALYQKRKTEEAWPKERLVPLLAGLAELLPWIHQWHNDPSDEYGGMRLGDFFQTFLEGELRALTLTPESLRAWRPTPKTRAKSPQKPQKSATPTPEETPGDE